MVPCPAPMDTEPRRRTAVHAAAYQFTLKRLREARTEAGLMQAEAARRLGRMQSYVSKCELGERRIDPIDLQDFAEVYHKPLGFFLPTRSDERD